MPDGGWGSGTWGQAGWGMSVYDRPVSETSTATDADAAGQAFASVISEAASAVDTVVSGGCNNISQLVL